MKSSSPYPKLNVLLDWQEMLFLGRESIPRPGTVPQQTAVRLSLHTLQLLKAVVSSDEARPQRGNRYRVCKRQRKYRLSQSILTLASRHTVCAETKSVYLLCPKKDVLVLHSFTDRTELVRDPKGFNQLLPSLALFYLSTQ